ATTSGCSNRRHTSEGRRDASDIEFSAGQTSRDNKGSAGRPSSDPDPDPKAPGSQPTASACRVTAAGREEGTPEKSAGHSASVAANCPARYAVVSSDTSCHPASRRSHFRPDYGA